MFNLCGEDVYIQIVKGENKHRPFTLEWRILLDLQKHAATPASTRHDPSF
jgi:hypothetical protein